MRIPVKSGAVIPVLILIPNILFLFMPPLTPAGRETAPLILTVAENIGRAAIVVMPLFYPLSLKNRFSKAALVLAALALLVYYAAWARYFFAGRSAELLSVPFLGIPLPMAVAPVFFLLVSAYLLSSRPVLAAALWFGIFHIWVSAITM